MSGSVNDRNHDQQVAGSDGARPNHAQAVILTMKRSLSRDFSASC
jgi:hypothetical protein